jgi:hypothetical protein
VKGLAHLGGVETTELARLADFQRWAIACEPAFSEPAAFQRAFAANMSDTVETLLDNDPVAKAIGSFMIARDAWEGTAAQLLAELERHDQTEARVTRLSTWPRDPARLSKALRAMHSTLAKAGIAIEFAKAVDRRRTRLVTLTKSAADKCEGTTSGISRITDEEERRSDTA